MREKIISGVAAVRFAALALVALAAAGGLVAAAQAVVPPCTTICYVSTTGDDTNGGTSFADAKLTIQAGVDQVSSGGTVSVEAGSYGESVAVGKAVTINGKQAGNPVGGRSFGVPGESTVYGQVTIAAPGVTFDGFSLRRAVATGAATGVVVEAAGDNAVIENVIFDTITSDDPAAGKPVDAGTAQAIYLDGADNVRIVGNRINNVRSNGYTRGILIGLATAPSSSDGVLIRGNTVSNVEALVRGAYGVEVLNGHGASRLTIDGNSFDTVKALNPISISDHGPGWVHAVGLEADTPDVVVVGNTFSGLQGAPAFNDQAAVWFEANPSYGTASVNRNSLDVGSIVRGIEVWRGLLSSSPGGIVDGSCNWWGSASGPAGVAAGSGSPVGPGVSYVPWLTSSNLSGPCDGGAPRVVKQALLAELQGLAGTDYAGDTEKKINEAIDHLGKSLKPDWWVDDSHVNKDKVFSEEKETVKKLGEIKDPVLFAARDGWIASIVAADRTLAEIAMGEWTGKQKELDEAVKELAKGDSERADSKFPEAIDHYKHAWEKVKP